mgnify:CR=1 FL=1
MFAYGPDELIKQVNEIITKNNSDDSEITVLKKGEMNSVLSVSRTKSIFEVDESIYFFKGWFQDHEAQSIVLGEKGFQDWLKRQGEVHDSIDFEGAYVSAKIKNDTLTVSNDTFSYFPVIYFVSDDLFVCSDSLFVLSELRKGLGMPCTLNKKTIDTRAWTHGLACAPMSNETQIEGVELLSPGKRIEFSLGGSISEEASIKIPKNVVKSKNLNEMFRMDFDDYTKAIRDAAKKIAESTVSLIQLEDVFIQFGLSGGLDSRIILAAILQKPELLEKVVIKTNTTPSRKQDFDVVSDLSQKYGFKFNDNEKLKLFKKNHTLKLEKVEDKFALWILSSMGLFDMMYLHSSYWPVPKIIELGGHGAETVKGTFNSKNYSNFPYVNPRFISIRHPFRNFKKFRESRLKKKNIRRVVFDAINSSGISKNQRHPLKWHHLCYKSPIQNGRFLDRSSIAIRPFVQKNLFALSISDINPFFEVKSGEPTILHDILILLNPELAAEEFENENSNISKEYIQSRLEYLGGRLILSDTEKFKVYGAVSDMRNGPPTTFLNMVRHDFGSEEDVEKTILETLKRTWSNVTDEDILSTYASTFEIAMERLTQSEPYLPNAGAPAAKIISLSLLDSK